MPKGVRLDLTGQRFGRLTVLRPGKAHTTPQGIKQTRWVCVCDCGTEKEILTHSLRQGTTVSCGCFGKAQRSAAAKATHTIHGATGTPEYCAWKKIKSRCYNPKVKEFRWYGARGIKMCDRWKNSFGAFLADVGKKPGRGYSIERIDNNKDYEPGNVRWATQLEQMQNTRHNRNITIDGRTQSMSAWAREYGIDVRWVHARLRLGWSEIDALTRPIKKRKPNL